MKKGKKKKKGGGGFKVTIKSEDPAAEKAVMKAAEILGDSADAATLIPEALKYL